MTLILGEIPLLNRHLVSGWLGGCPPKRNCSPNRFSHLPIYPRFFSHSYASRSLYDLTNCVGGPQLANVFFHPSRHSWWEKPCKKVDYSSHRGICNTKSWTVGAPNNFQTHSSSLWPQPYLPQKLEWLTLKGWNCPFQEISNRSPLFPDPEKTWVSNSSS